MNDRITIEDVEIFAYHGVFPEEKQQGQVFLLTAVLTTDFSSAAKEDDLQKTVDYGKVCEIMAAAFTERSYDLIETAARRTAAAVLRSFDGVESLTLTVSKPHAPLSAALKTVSVTCTLQRHRVYLSIGSNIGDREAFLREAIRQLDEHPECTVKKVSSLINTEPYGGVEQEDFLNGAVLLETLLSPHELLQFLHQLEEQAGRKRTVRWGRRTLDLDILLYDRQVIEEEELQIPHIDMHNRRFVLEPMTEIAPFVRHPLLHKTMAELLKELKR